MTLLCLVDAAGDGGVALALGDDLFADILDVRGFRRVRQRSGGRAGRVVALMKRC